MSVSLAPVVNCLLLSPEKSHFLADVLFKLVLVVQGYSVPWAPLRFITMYQERLFLPFVEFTQHGHVLKTAPNSETLDY